MSRDPGHERRVTGIAGRVAASKAKRLGMAIAKTSPSLWAEPQAEDSASVFCSGENYKLICAPLRLSLIFLRRIIIIND